MVGERMWWWSSSSTKLRSNLERFLRGITPKPPSFSLSQSCKNDLNSLWIHENKDEIEYFRLSDLWDCFDEPSAYGLGSKVDLNNGESVMQYYVPYLSAIQIYTNKSTAISRIHSDVVDCESECWSDDSEIEKLSRSMSSGSSKIWDSVSDDSGYEIDGTSSLMRDKLGSIDFQYFESVKPHLRVPLTAKVNELAEKYPGLSTLRSVDLSPASWLAIAWYPIYHIPSRKTDKDLSTCFLSYHTLSSAFQGNLIEGDDEINETMKEETLCFDEGPVTKSIPLAPFGLVSYKLQGDLWRNQECGDQGRIVYLRSAADSWLKQLNVQDHHDHSFFSMNMSL
ncbi:Strong similarity to a hypothetical protein T18K17.12 gi/6598871 from Arabidopsis thaliana BAC T18K17 gb/AC010556. EST gb/AI996552 comes from this gene [Arabidopsis thaliana]|uniref:At1g17830 n=1 Tax=Arabidopsis thaliana TaxID=3702 RepID=Q9LMU5_ARATH|nr:hypothetical protein (DUF789) [Arabidopsis thaliana]AAF97263.1 Strong similarity to a hypothetical protein T18K17.12 gi/6598871 from Arabidopsis thaliana BAC T18K17 gb/AC010556. EST gb/AI996552 comes from this gene [Arabidopsis thaliana]ACB88835.1 At1g17830 [Arabidopsis thaliana]AEE29641.1 hypothetical protein (DUF789) [Arabidopsis thaliana]|eukprot:NP_564038.1 hypothetical protein (DUF789) [Arabidopsis thaliana]